MERAALIFVFLMLLAKPVFGAGFVIENRHFIAAPAWWSLKTPKTFTLELEATNEKQTPVKIRASVERVNFTQDAISNTGSFIAVSPETTVLFPGRSERFKFLVPWDEGRSVFYRFQISPDESPQKGLIVQTVISQLFCVTFLKRGEKYDIRPEMTSRPRNGSNVVLLTNPAPWVMEITARALRADKMILRGHRWLLPGEVYEITYAHGEDCVVDVAGLDTRLGLRLPR